jgi:uncharacterized protein YndB with AHSA1/START domain
MVNELIFRKTIMLDAPASTVWKALTDPQQTKQYMFNCEVVTDWQPENPIIWKGAQDGIVYVKGIIKKVIPGKYLEYTTFDPRSSIKDDPENYLTVTETLEEQDGKTKLTVTDGDFSKVEQGEKRYHDTIGGWDHALSGLKKLVES